MHYVCKSLRLDLEAWIASDEALLKITILFVDGPHIPIRKGLHERSSPFK